MTFQVDKQIRIIGRTGDYVTLMQVTSPEQVGGQVTSLTVTITDQRGDVDKECGIILDTDELRKALDEL